MAVYAADPQSVAACVSQAVGGKVVFYVDYGWRGRQPLHLSRPSDLHSCGGCLRCLIWSSDALSVKARRRRAGGTW